MSARPPLGRRLLVTLTTVLVAALLVAFFLRRHFLAPWTRDGQVEAQVVRVAARVDGPIVALPIVDNQPVSKGDLLFQIDPRTFQAAVNVAQGELDEAKAKLVDAKDQADRMREARTNDPGAIAMEELVSKESMEKLAEAAVTSAQAQLEAAKLDLEFTKVTSPVNGYVTHLKLDIGTQAVADEPALALVDRESFYVMGYFRETEIDRVRVDDVARVTLMSYPDRPIDGKVQGIGWGISRADGQPGYDLLPEVAPTFEWVRLAQRIPVRIELGPLPEGVELRVGTTTSVQIRADR